MPPPSTTHLSSIPWADLTWNTAGLAINKYAKTPSAKLFLMKILYDALPNEYTKFKYAIKPNTAEHPYSQSDLPACPLCLTTTDSLSHLFCNCPHPEITTLRHHLIHRISLIKLHTPISNPIYSLTHHLTNLILSTFNSNLPDHRILLGLFHLPSLPTPLAPLLSIKPPLQDIVHLTAPFLRDCWKKYCEFTHPPHSQTTNQSSQSSQQPSRFLVISGNSAILSLQTVQDHPPPLYHTTSAALVGQHDPAPTIYITTHNAPFSRLLLSFPMLIKNTSHPSSIHFTPHSRFHLQHYHY